MDMVQDHDGMIWFATWDGINRFNGYDFKVYKARKENDMLWSSNRVDHLQVDKQGDVWCITYVQPSAIAYCSLPVVFLTLS